MWTRESLTRRALRVERQSACCPIGEAFELHLIAGRRASRTLPAQAFLLCDYDGTAPRGSGPRAVPLDAVPADVALTLLGAGWDLVRVLRWTPVTAGGLEDVDARVSATACQAGRHAWAYLPRWGTAFIYERRAAAFAS